MKPRSTIFLRAAVWLLGIIVIGLCVFVIPAAIRDEDWAAYRPILFGMYVSVMPFFFALYQTLKLLKNIDDNMAFSNASITALKYVKCSAYVISGLYVIGLPYIFHVSDKNDSPGGIVLGLLVIGTSFVIATSAAVLQKLLESAIAIKSENDLTV